MVHPFNPSTPDAGGSLVSYRPATVTVSPNLRGSVGWAGQCTHRMHFRNQASNLTYNNTAFRNNLVNIKPLIKNIHHYIQVTYRLNRSLLLGGSQSILFGGCI